MADNDEELWAMLEELGESIGQAQAMNRLSHYVLLEVVRDLAVATSDPHKYLAAMFERVSARADVGPIADEAHPSTVEFRAALAQFFSMVGRHLPKQ